MGSVFCVDGLKKPTLLPKSICLPLWLSIFCCGLVDFDFDLNPNPKTIENLSLKRRESDRERG